MKTRILFLLSVLCCCTPLLLAQSPGGEYPAYSWINPYPRVVVRSDTACVFQFSDPKAQAGWDGFNQSQVVFAEGKMQVKSLGVDPYFSSPLIPTYSDKVIDGSVEFRVTMKSDMGTVGQIFWVTETDGNYAEERSAKFSVENDGELHTYSASGMIDGRMLRFRFDPGNKKGTAEITRIEIIQNRLSPLEVTNMISNNDFAEIEITNLSDRKERIGLWKSNDEKGESRPERQILEPRQKIKAVTWFAKKEPFELAQILISSFKKNEAKFFIRSAYAFHKEIETKWISLKSDSVECLFAENGSGAKIMRDGKLVGIICPLAYEDVALPPGNGNPGDRFKEKPPRSVPFPSGVIPLKFKQNDARSITFFSDNHVITLGKVRIGQEIDPKSLKTSHNNDPVRSLTFTLEGDELQFELNASDNVFGPVFRPIGTQEQAVLSGVEYLERGEHSSSTADIETAEHIRFAPDPLLLTMPFAGIITDRASFGLLWDDPNDRVIFATPDFIEGKQPGDLLQHRMSLCGGKVSGTLRVGPAYGKESGQETIEDAILWAVNKRGLPELPRTYRTQDEQRQLNLAGLMQSQLKGDGGWAHAILPDDSQPFARTYGADYVSTVWQLSGQLPEVPVLVRGGSHLENPVAFFLTGKGQDWLDQANAEAAHLRSTQKEDGSFRYSGKYLKGHWENTASGYCGQFVYWLFEHYRRTGNPESLAAAIKGTDYLNHFRNPRGAQVWELSIHTPDIMGSGWCCISNVRAFEITGKAEYLRDAKRWAITGLPFVYQWDGITAKKRPAGGRPAVMLYATTPVLGATNWIAPNWIGLPVQWCGLDYAEGLFLLAPYENSLDWRKIAEGILIAGEQMQYTNGPSVGLLPDSWTLRTQTPNPFDINPCVLERLRRRMIGELPAVDIAVSPDGRSRVLAPFPIRFEGNTPVFESRGYGPFQILLNGEVRDVPATKGE